MELNMLESSSEFPCTIELRFTREEYKTLMNFIDRENPAKPLVTTHPDAGVSFLETVLLRVCKEFPESTQFGVWKEVIKLKDAKDLADWIEWREFREWREVRKAAE